MDQDAAMAPENVEDDLREDVTPANGAGKVENNLLGELRAKRRERSKRTTVKLPIPGWSDALVAEYRVIDWDELKRIADEVEKSRSPRATLYGHVQTLVSACVGFYVKPDSKTDLVPLNETVDEFGEAPVLYDTRLVQATGIEPSEPKARAILRALFDDDYLVTLHHNEYMEWRGEASNEEDEDFSKPR